MNDSLARQSSSPTSNEVTSCRAEGASLDCGLVRVLAFIEYAAIIIAGRFLLGPARRLPARHLQPLL